MRHRGGSEVKRMLQVLHISSLNRDFSLFYLKVPFISMNLFKLKQEYLKHIILKMCIPILL